MRLALHIIVAVACWALDFSTLTFSFISISRFVSHSLHNIWSMNNKQTNKQTEKHISQQSNEQIQLPNVQAVA